jgi:hypothetical protein
MRVAASHPFHSGSVAVLSLFRYEAFLLRRTAASPLPQE